MSGVESTSHDTYKNLWKRLTGSLPKVLLWKAVLEIWTNACRICIFHEQLHIRTPHWGCFWRHIHCTKVNFSIKAFLSKCDQIRSFLRIWSHLLKKALMRNFIFCAVKYSKISKNFFWPANRVWNNLLRKDDDIFWHGWSTGYYCGLYLWTIVLSGFRPLEVYKNLWPFLGYYHFYSQQPRW